MVFSIALVCASLAALTAHALPLEKRIAQVISDSTQPWVQACTAAGGADKCGTTSQTAFMALLAGGGDCDQQDAADSMIDLAKQLNNNAKMISLAQVFAQQPRNSPDKLSVKYCQKAPKNSELQGLFQCQFQGVDPKTFTNNVAVGGQGTIPFGLNAPVNPPGSCKANPQGGIADGSQLVSLTQDPGVGSTGGAQSGNSTSGAASSNGTTSASPSSDDGSTNGSATGSSNTSDDSGAAGSDAGAAATTTPTLTAAGDATGAAATASAADSAAVAGSTTSAGAQSGNGSGNAGSAGSAGGNGAASTGNSQLQNGKDAQALNAKFASLTDSSACNEGDQACVNKGFAQCVGGKFQTTQCAGGTQCFALPLVNKAGTSIACTTQSDATSRIQATGATGGLTGA